MEAIEEPPPPQNISTEAAKATVSACEESAGVETPVQSNVCHKPNGVSDLQDSELVQLSLDAAGSVTNEHISNIGGKEDTHVIISEQETLSTEIIVEETTFIEDEPLAVEEVPQDVSIIEQNLDEIELKTDHNETTEHVEVDGIVEAMPENVRFETEILIETNVDDQTTKYKIIYDDDSEQPDHTNNILNELGQNIELSEVLRSSDNVENNNCDVTQEVFNKEELLDILEGNDMDESRKVISENFVSDSKKLETQLALQQLSRLKQSRKSRSTPKKPDKKPSKKSDSPKEESVRKRSSRHKEDSLQANSSAILESKEDNTIKKRSKQKDDTSQSNSDATPELNVKKKSEKQQDDNLQTSSDPVAEPKGDSVVNALVKDWDDDELAEGDQAKQLKEEGHKLLGESEELVKSQEATLVEEIIESVGDGQTPNLNKSESETQPQRRLSRVIKKKVIYDPDNPDTFTKTKIAVKKENQSEKDQKDQSTPIPKRIKTEQTTPRSQSKSPVQSKLQWKKPQPKNIKQKNRLTEIDRLLMDEGAVNMICQLTPEAPQGNKNMKSKAEFIKKIQSSTPEGKEMKFRERIKKEYKGEEADAKRIGGGKERFSLSGSVKSPTVSEDFEAHCADDSIIYRRHSSSSYSSPCMSPRRMSDVETINQNANVASHQAASDGNETPQEAVPTGSDVFMAETPGTMATAVIKKSHFLSIKEKLNSKLSQALNKRKRESNKADKPMKVKKVCKPSEKKPNAEYKYVKLTYDRELAEVSILNEGTIFTVEVVNELKAVLEAVDSKNDISVTLLKAESGTLCPMLELSSMLDQKKGANYAIELAESARSLLSTLERHSKLLCTVVGDRCHSFGLAIVALSDITVASESAVFELSAFKGAPLLPGVTALTSCGLSQSLLSSLLVAERAVCAAEAQRGGLVSRTVWAARAHDQARLIALDIAAQPHENVMLKKQLLRLKRGSSESFLTSLQTERDLFVNYWMSEEGRELVRASSEIAKE